jgi:hypothetical protein
MKKPYSVWQIFLPEWIFRGFPNADSLCLGERVFPAFPILKGYKTQSFSSQFLTSGLDQFEQSRHLNRMARVGVRLSVRVPSDHRNVCLILIGFVLSTPAASQAEI